MNSFIFSDLIHEEPDEIIQLITTEGDSQISDDELPDELPILPVKNTVLFPGVVIPITVGRQRSVKLVKKAYKGDRIIGVVAQKNVEAEEPEREDVYHVGTIAKVIKMIVLPDGSTTIIIQGRRKFEIDNFTKEDPFLMARYHVVEDKFPKLKKNETSALIESLKESASKILNLNPEIPQEAQLALDNIDDPSFLMHFLSSNINADVSEKQGLLELSDGMKRATKLLKLMDKDIQMLELKNEIHKKVHSDLDQQQRDYFLRQQMKVLQDELGYDSHDQEIQALKEKAVNKKWGTNVEEHFEKEIIKVSRMNPAAAEYPLTINYLELLVDLPWEEYTKDVFDLKKAKQLLDKDHFGLGKVKDRILEYLAVLKLKQDMKGPILCLYGPPGVGKTSLGKSIAQALGRKYVRMSLGGLHDEAEIRGHRKTYIGALPGKVIQNIKKSKSSNPVFILDEIDKVNSDFRGDPSSALLEVLDPEQNSTFVDNYLEVEYDLSKVLFIATANSLDTIQPALRDRMEVIEVTGYTIEEKVQIAKKHLVPKLRKEHGLKATDITLTDSVIRKVVEGYTRESGVRGLERKLGALIRNIAKSIATEEEYTKRMTVADVIKILGVETFDKESYQDHGVAGVVTGLAWTPVGGEILYVESTLSQGKGKLTLSGQLGDVMKESAMAALSYLRAHAGDLSLDPELFEQYDLHIHVPAGAVPKDGPSAGITMFTSLASLYTQRRVKEKVAMTGEITLTGRVLPIGGVKEKILAARRAGIKDIILPIKNKKDVDDIQADYINNINFHFVQTVDEVLKVALLKEKVKKPLSLKLQDKTAKTA